MKKNNKGFTLIETLIVSAFVIGTLMYIYIQMNNTLTNYDITFRYDSINAVYNANTISNYLVQNGYGNLVTQLSSNANGYIDITSSASVTGNSNYYSLLVTETNAKTVLFTSMNMSTIKEKIKASAYSEELKRYVAKHDYSASVAGQYQIIVEFKDNTFASVKIG